MKLLNQDQMSSTTGGLFKGCGAIKRAYKRAKRAGYSWDANTLYFQWTHCKG